MIIDILDTKFPGGRQLQVAREMSRLSQASTARAMNVVGSRVSYIERCDVMGMRLDTLARYVDAIGGRLTVTVEIDVPRETSTEETT